MKMKRLFWICCFIAVFGETALGAFDGILTDALKNDPEIIFAYTANFSEGSYLLTASLSERAVAIRAYDERDGEEITDELTLDVSENESCHTELVSDGSFEYVLTEKTKAQKTERKIYTIADDAFREAPAGGYTRVTRIAGISGGKAKTYGNTKGGAYNLLNRLKEKRIEEYRFINRLSGMDNDGLWELKVFIAACADIMSYDRKRLDFDALMKYVLNTHRNFLQLTGGDPGPYSGAGGAVSGGLCLVKTEFIDNILTSVFNLEPVHPPMNELSAHGFCENGGYYYYRPAFNVFYGTELRDIKAAYDLGGGIYYIVFTDIYTEGDTAVPEYSFAVVKRASDGLTLLRLEMGGKLPDESEVLEYAPVREYRKFAWESETDEYSEPFGIFEWILLCGAVLLVAAAVVAAFKLRCFRKF